MGKVTWNDLQQHDVKAARALSALRGQQRPATMGQSQQKVTPEGTHTFVSLCGWS